MKTTQLFILGTGRSGTTLIQRFFNAHSKVMIWGEHSGFLKDIAKSYFHLKNCPSMQEYSYQHLAPSNYKKLSEYYKDPKKWQAWVNWFHPNEVDEFYRSLLEQIFDPKKVGRKQVWGFKEIRYGEDQEVVNFLKALYPEAVFISVVREGLNVIESQLSTFYQGISKYPKIKRLVQLPTLIRIAYKWRTMNHNLAQLAENKNFFFIKYEDFITDHTLILDIMKNIGIEIESQQTDVLNIKEGRGSSFDVNSNVNDRWKNMGFFPALVAECIIGKASLKFGYKRPRSLWLGTRLSNIFST